jgi:hypothetical protein
MDRLANKMFEIIEVKEILGEASSEEKWIFDQVKSSFIHMFTRGLQEVKGLLCPKFQLTGLGLLPYGLGYHKQGSISKLICFTVFGTNHCKVPFSQ